MKKLDTKENCYLASGWFNDEEESCRQDILSALNEVGISYFSPKDEVEVKTGATQEELRAAFDADVNFIKECDFVVASTAGRDLGTMMELGMAYAWGIPSVVYFRAPKGTPCNLMLAQSAYKVAQSKDELVKILKDLKANGFDFSNKSEWNGDIE